MALDKVVDSAKLNGALKATADAIRSKTGSTDSVPFDPSTGFKTIIDSMEVGGGGSGGGGESGGGEGATGWEILMPTTNISFINGGEYLSTENVYPLVSGAVYKVVWGDGQIYDNLIASNVVFQGMDAIAIGNAGALVGNPSAEPFVIGYIPLANGFGVFRIDGADATASVEIQKQAKAYTVTFMSENGSELLGTKVVFDGNTCGGLSITPTKESTDAFDYSFLGWATTPNGAMDENVFVNITTDKTLYANFASAVRYYTINYYDGDTLLKSEQLAYGSTPRYVPEKDGYMFGGWNPTVTTVAGDANYYAIWLSDAIASGTCGDSAIWSLSSKYKLTISGSGAMYDYANNEEREWDSYKADITSVVINDGITYVGLRAFSDFTSLNDVVWPENIKTVERSVFYNCSSLTDLSFLPSDITKIGQTAFYGCSGLTTYDMNWFVTDLGAGAFRNCTNLTSITLYLAGKGIPNDIVRGCTSLATITITGGYSSIGTYAFADTKITDFDVYSSCTEVGNGAFYGCPALETVTISGSYTKRIGTQAFSNCTTLKTITIGSGVKIIGQYAFYGCSGLTSAKFSVTSGWYTATSETSTTAITTLSMTSSKAVENLTSNYYYVIKHP